MRSRARVIVRISLATGQIGKQVEGAGDEDAVAEGVATGDCGTWIGDRLDPGEARAGELGDVLGLQGARVRGGGRDERGAGAGGGGGGGEGGGGGGGEPFEDGGRILVGEDRGDDDVVVGLRKALEQP